MNLILSRLGAIVLFCAILLQPSGLRAQYPDPGGSQCDPYDELRCTNGYDWQHCTCIGESPPQPNPCGSIYTEQTAQACLNQRLSDLAKVCQERHWSYQTNPWVQETFSSFWSWTFNLDAQMQWRVTLPQMPVACR